MLTVSVVVPVWNPGESIDRSIRSLLKQTLPVEEWEVIFVDDGSDDGTEHRLDELAAAHPHFRVIHQENSGWPGKPRNVGIAAANGRWVQFLDQDDSLAPDALRRLTTYGDESDADVVLGKVNSDWRPVGHDVYAETRGDANLSNSLLIQSLTPHKMFRRSFLLEHDIRFPEGKRRLEDQVFMVHAYVLARSCAIVADYNCYNYLRRTDQGNSGSTRFEPVSYYRDLEDVFDIIDRHVEPGPLRDSLYRRFLSSEILRRTYGTKVVDWTPDYRDELWRVVRDLVIRRCPDSAVRSLPAIDRCAIDLLLASRGEDLLTLARRRAKVRVLTTAGNLQWQEGRWTCNMSAGLRYTDGTAFRLVRNPDGNWCLDPRLLPSSVNAFDYDVTAELSSLSAATLLVRRGNRMTWFAEADWDVSLEEHGDEASLAISGLTTLRQHGEDIEPLSRGTWDVRSRIRAFGMAIGGGVDLVDSRVCPPALYSKIGAVTAYSAAPQGKLALDVTEKVLSLPEQVARGRVGPLRQLQNGDADLDVSVLAGDDGAAVDATATLTRESVKSPPIPARFESRGGRVTLRLSPAAGSLDTLNGKWRLEVATAHGAPAGIGRVDVRDGILRGFSPLPVQARAKAVGWRATSWKRRIASRLHLQQLRKRVRRR